MINDLLDVAEKLARLDRTRPQQVNLRRAASSCYYALFHALTELAANALVGERDRASSAAYTRVYRALSHTQAKKILEKRTVQQLGDDLSKFADAFITLQEARERCDYDPSPLGLSRQTILSYIDVGRAAISHLRGLTVEVRLDLATALHFPTRK